MQHNALSFRVRCHCIEFYLVPHIVACQEPNAVSMMILPAAMRIPLNNKLPQYPDPVRRNRPKASSDS